MYTLATLITVILAVLCNVLPPEPFYPQLPPEDVVTLHTFYMPIVLKPDGNIATMVQDINNILDEPITIDNVSDCGQYAEWGGHPCPQNDNANPPAYNNRNH